MLCKIQIEINKAILRGDTKEIKDYSSAYATFAKQAQLDEMIETTKTNEITTVAELMEFLEKNGYQFKFYDGVDRDLVDKAIKDMQETNRRAILEATGLTTILENLAKQKAESDELEKTAKAVAKTPIEGLELDEEPDDEANSELTD
jgi:tRNA G10  N-methylase Trm11